MNWLIIVVFLSISCDQNDSTATLKTPVFEATFSSDNAEITIHKGNHYTTYDIELHPVIVNGEKIWIHPEDPIPVSAYKILPSLPGEPFVEIPPELPLTKRAIEIRELLKIPMPWEHK